MIEGMEGLEVRSLEYGDLDEVLQLERECFPHPWSRGMLEEEVRHPDGVFLVARSGVIKELESYLAEATKTGGMLTAVGDRMQKQIKDFQAQAERLEKRIESYEARLLRQYSAMETILSSMQSQSRWLENQITVLNRSWSRAR